MGTPSRKTPQRIQRVRELHRQGGSTREIAEDVGVSHVTVGQWLAEMGLDPNGGHGERKARKRRSPGAAAGAIADATNALASFVDGRQLFDRATALQQLSKRLAQISTLASQLGAGVPSGEANASAFATVVKLERELAAGIVELEPPAPPDPDSDPTNLQAAADLRAKVGRLVETARSKARCVHCGANPFVKGRVA